MRFSGYFMRRVWLGYWLLTCSWFSYPLLANDNQDDIIKGEYIIKLKKSSGKSASLVASLFTNFAKKLGIKVFRPYRLFQSFHHVQATQTALFTLIKYQSDIEYIEPVYRVWIADRAVKEDIRAETVTPDPKLIEGGDTIELAAQLSDQWGLDHSGDFDVNAFQAWKMTTGSKNVVVAVIDSGIDYNHPALHKNIWHNTGEIEGNGIDDDGNGFIDDVIGWDFYHDDPWPYDDHRHGTHCSGVIGGHAKNLKGVSPNVKIMGLKFLGKSGGGSTANAIKAIDYAISNGAQIMNNSWGGGSFSRALEEVILESNKRGVLFVVAAGNSNKNLDSVTAYPASYKIPNVLSVAANKEDGTRASFSNYGKTTVHVSAPGYHILSSVPQGKVQYLNGTSMAAPFVSGIAALLLAANPKLDHLQLKDYILQNVKKVSALTDYTIAGGITDAEASLKAVIKDLQGEPVSEPDPITEPTPDPVTDPTPDPVTDPTPDPVTDPTPIPVPEPTPPPQSVFDWQETTFSKSIYRPWYSSYFRYTFKLKMTAVQLKQISSVKFILSESLNNAPIPVEKAINGVVDWKISSKATYNKIKIQVLLISGETSEKEQIF